mgnify:CR=1 FL=1
MIRATERWAWRRCRRSHDGVAGGVITGNTIDWTALSIANAAAVVLTFDATVLSTGNYVNVAEIVAANETDLDSTPNNGADTNGDGKVSPKEQEMYMEFRRKELEDQDAMRDAQRKMAWFSLGGMLLYPFAVVLASLAGLDEAQKTLGSTAPTYFVAVAGIVAAFFGAQALGKK